MMTQQEQRDAVIAEALTWQGTPYHHMARLKGIGCDCLTYLAGVFENCGLIDHIEIPFYPMDWALHRDAERYFDGLLKYTCPVETPQPGDIALWKFGRCYSHGAIVITWPKIINSELKSGVRLDDALKNQRLTTIGERGPDNGKPRPVKFFSYWGR